MVFVWTTYLLLKKFPLSLFTFFFSAYKLLLGFLLIFPFLVPSGCDPFPSSTKQTVLDTRPSTGPSQISVINFLLSSQPNINFTTFLNLSLERLPTMKIKRLINPLRILLNLPKITLRYRLKMSNSTNNPW